MESGISKPESVPVLLRQIEHPIHDIGSIIFETIFIRTSCQFPHSMPGYTTVHVLPLCVMSPEALLEGGID